MLEKIEIDIETKKWLQTLTWNSFHNHTDFSNTKFPDSICKTEDLIDYAHELGMRAVAITDHDCVSSYIRAEKHLSSRKEEYKDDKTWQDFRLIYGNEIYLCRNGLNKDNFIRGKDKFYHFILLAKNLEGNKQIRKISSRAWKRSFMWFHRRVPTYYSDLREIIQENKGNIIATTACLGSWLDNYIMEAKDFEGKDEDKYNEYYATIAQWISQMQSVFGAEDFYLELQPGLSKEQIYVNKKLLKLGKELNVPCTMATDSHFLRAEDRPIHKAYLNSKEGEREVDDFYEAAFMMDIEEVWSRVGSYISKEDFEMMMNNTMSIRDKCEDYSLKRDLKLPYMPDKEMDLSFSILNNINITKEQAPNFIRFLNSSETADKQLATRIYNYLIDKNTFGDFESNLQRMDYELGVVWDSSEKQNVHWSKYLLQMADYCNIIWKEGDSLICPSRGSAGSSYIMYALGIIQIDPTREKAPLLFERFMNPERASVLDVDIDVEAPRRNNCIRALERKYGKNKVVRVCTFKTEKAKSALLAAARGLGIDIDIASYLASLVGSERGLQYSLSDMYYGNVKKDLKPSSTFINEMNKYPKLWEVAQKIEGLINGVGIHAGGVIISDEDIDESAAVMTTTKGELVTCFDLHDAEEVGQIKIDLLATEGLAKVRTCIDLLVDYGYLERKATLKETYESAIGVYHIEREDKDMWKLVWNNSIVSLFQMEKQSGIQGISLTKPQSLEDLAILNSVIRLMAPKPGDEQPLEKYARFKNNREDWELEMLNYDLTTEERELLHSLLDYSYGICAHQEDLYHLITHPQIAGMTLGDADVLRKAVAKKAPKDYDAFEKRYWDNMKEKGLSEQLCQYVWNVLIATQRG